MRPGTRPDGSRRPGWWMPALIAVLAVLAIGLGGGLALLLDDDGGPAVGGPAGATPTPTDDGSDPTPTDDPGPGTTELPVPPSTSGTPVLPSAARANVRWTCGNGDCFVSERAGPRVDASQLATHGEGARVLIVCEVRGERVRSSERARSSEVWGRTADGGYIAAVFLDGLFSSFHVSTPCP